MFRHIHYKSFNQLKILFKQTCDSCPLLLQIKRLRLCERMLVAMELSGWLNESSLALQAVIQSYGLLAPLIHYKIPVVPVMQVRVTWHTGTYHLAYRYIITKHTGTCHLAYMYVSPEYGYMSPGI